jgi:hypothetical protein
MKRYVIRYRSASVTNGYPVGVVYALDVSDFAGRGAWSYVKDPREATIFPTEEAAERAMAGNHWPEATVSELLDDLVVSM